MTKAKFKFKFAIPTVILFATPWMHKLLYNNLLAAWPEIDHFSAHMLGFLGAFVAAFVTVMWVDLDRE